MKKCFNNVQMLGAGEDCDKLSKSVSYETLVGGTATIGTGIKQIQRLFLGSADKPLSAVGTLTSLLCNSAKVMEKLLSHVITRRTSVRRGYLPEQGTQNKESLFANVTCFMRLPRRIQRMLLVMTFPVLALLFTIITTAESRAEIKCQAQTIFSVPHECIETWNPGVADNCGDGCTYTYNNGKLIVTATKEGASIKAGVFSPYYYATGTRPKITDIEIDGEFKSFGDHAFYNVGATVHGKNGVLYADKAMRKGYFGDNNTLTGTVIFTDDATRIDFGPLYATNIEATVILPPTITSISGWAMSSLKLGENAKIYCGAENCEELFRNVDCEGFSANESYRTACKNRLNNLLSSGKLLSYPENCLKMGAGGCIKCKSASFKLNDGYCDRIRYTPAEAAKVLRNDNTNEVTITFKK